MGLVWHDRAFGELSVGELYAITALREAVFVVEQNCVYLDADGLDPSCRHLWAAENHVIHAYCRLVPAHAKYPEASIGRVIVAPAARGTGLGKDLITRAIAACGAGPIRIGAQAYLTKFYSELGFVITGDPYVEDGIPHIEMVR